MWRVTTFYMIPAFGTLRQVWTVFADHSAALIFTISITVGCTVGQYLIVWTDIAIIILIINVLIFLEEPLFWSWDTCMAEAA